MACGGETAGTDHGSGAIIPDGGWAPPDASASDGRRADAGQGSIVSSPSEGGACVIPASNYDQSCATDSDCVPVNSAYDWCTPLCNCGSNDAINGSAMAQYTADTSRTPVGSGAVSVGTCMCPGRSGPSTCCHAGMCIVYEPQLCPDSPSGFTPATEEPDAGPEAGADGENGGVLCSLYAGPVDADVPDVGPTRRCSADGACSTYNGGWACCQGAGGVDFCVVPSIDGGGP